DYWVRHVREAVRFADGIGHLESQGVTTYLELGPGGVLSAMAQDTTADAVFVPALRKNRPETEAVVTALAELHVHGTRVDWTTYYAGTGAQRTDLPTYAFQRQHYWLESPSGGGMDARGLGLEPAEHPLLGARAEVAGSEVALFTGSLSATSHAWLADHVVMGTQLVPGTALVDWALHAGGRVGTPVLEELTLRAPLVLPGQGATAVQVAVEPPDAEGRRAVRVHSRTSGEDGGGPWVLHATGVLKDASPAAAVSLEEWPPAGAEEVGVDTMYAELDGLGLEYGPAFRGLRAMWRRGDEVFAEVVLPDGPEVQAGDVDGYGVHPALMDAALHPVGLGPAPGRDADAGQGPSVGLPFAWSDVRLHAVGARRLRVWIAPSEPSEPSGPSDPTGPPDPSDPSGSDGKGVSVVLADGTGAPVASVGSLALRPVTRDQLAAAGRGGFPGDALFRVDWVPLGEPPAGVGAGAGVGADGDVGGGVGVGDADGWEVLTVADAEADVHHRVTRVLERLQVALSEERPEGRRLVVVTCGAVAPDGGDVPDLGAAAVWGLVRSAQSEHPGRMVLVDTDGSVDDLAALAHLDEPQLVVRDGVPYGARLVRADALDDGDRGRLDVDGTVLVTGASGTLGGLVARHLVAAGGARDLVLVSRRGAQAPGTAELVAALREAGATVRVEACDVADRTALAALVASITSGGRRLAGVVHTAGVLDDGVLGSLTAERVARVFRPKADAARHLHDLTAGLDLSFFVLFSSIAGVLGAPGQANYAAANAYVDALAQHRRALGLPAASLAWGPWAESGMLGSLSEADVRRIRRSGMEPMPAARGLQLFDAAVADGRPAALVPVVLDLPAWRRNAAEAGTVPPLLRQLVRAVPPRAAASDAGAGAGAVTERTLLDRLAEAAPDKRHAAVLDVVASEVASVLGHAAGHRVGARQTFSEMGFDSLTAVELRNRLNAVTGLRLPATLVFNQPTPDELATHVLGLLGPVDRAAGRDADLDAELRRLEELFEGLTPERVRAATPDGKAREAMTQRLQSLLSRWHEAASSGGLEDGLPTGYPDGFADGFDDPSDEGSAAGVREDLDAASDDELFAFIDERFSAA
ncbi:SDR family NAD(P)-dependent oxidoreductase, partial [Streptomyces sp. KLOTTS4A1]|uniref:type I polyketide synthase n=1 Tax=Streptomyces sp. KLOTTS4A1 TaxID=3390996 RepID=UPI0039F447F6